MTITRSRHGISWRYSKYTGDTRRLDTQSAACARFLRHIAPRRISAERPQATTNNDRTLEGRRWIRLRGTRQSSRTGGRLSHCCDRLHLRALDRTLNQGRDGVSCELRRPNLKRSVLVKCPKSRLNGIGWWRKVGRACLYCSMGLALGPHTHTSRH